MDENVPDSVSMFLRERGHEVYLARDVVLPRTPDLVVAAVADQKSAIVVTWNVKDFKRINARVAPDGFIRFRRAGGINFRCNEAHGRRRIEELIESIEFEFEQSQKRRDKRLFIDISETRFSVIR